ncbi:MAG: hypothetical protein C0423_05840 [Methylibium sp.]|nr:hypothetical protein [Methylibium sp.]
MHIGFEEDTGHIYEGAGRPEYAVVPPPLLTQAKLIESEVDAANLPRGISMDALRWLFREDSFDPVTRVRRGRLYQPFPAGQPDECLTRGHPSMQFANHRQGESMTKRLHHHWPCQELLGKPRGGQGMTLALGRDRAWSMWRIVQVEQVVGDDVLVTLKALSSFGVLPEARLDSLLEEHRQPVQRALDRVLDSAFRETAISVIDQCRNALMVLLGRWLASQSLDSKVVELDLGKLVRRIREAPYELNAAAGVAEAVAKLHPRGKANEQETRGLRLAQEEDAELSVHAVGFVMRELRLAQ